MNQENKDNQDQIKRRKSCNLVYSTGMAGIRNLLKDNSDKASAQSTNSSSNYPLLGFNCNSLFAYQENDQYTSLCDNETYPLDILDHVANLPPKKEEGEDSDKSLSQYDKSENEDISDEMIDKKCKTEKRKSAFYSVPIYVSQFRLRGNEGINITNPNNNQKIVHVSESSRQVNQCLKCSNIIPNIQNYNNNIRRNSQTMIPFQNPLMFNNPSNPINSFPFRQNQMSGVNNFYNMNNNINNINNTANNSCGQKTLNHFLINNNKNPNYMGGYPFNIPPNYNNFDNNYKAKRNSVILSSNYFLRQDSLFPRNTPNKNIAQQYNSPRVDKKNNEDIEENPSHFLDDQLYCRQIQNKLEINKNNVKYMYEFYDHIKGRLIEIIEHQFGNYVLQKYLSVLLYQENKKLFGTIFIDIKDKLFEICIHNFGTRVIQKTLEKLDDGNYIKIETPELDDIIKKLIEEYLYELCCDKNGNHVYQKLLRIYPKEKNDFLFDSLNKIVLKVAVIQQGATLLQAVFDQSNKNQLEKLCMTMVNKIEDLINDKYGNYTIQTIIKLENEKVNERIFIYINENLTKLSKEKFSSNVIDKCIINNNVNTDKIIHNMVQNNLIKEIVVDQYGNYVIQKALAVSEGEIFEKIMEQVKPTVPELQKTNIGKKILERLTQQYKEYFN